MNEHCFYIIEDEYFELVKDPYLKFNKGKNSELNGVQFIYVSFYFDLLSTIM